MQRRGVACKRLTKKSVTKRNNRKIHTRKFLTTPEGKPWLGLMKVKEAEIKLATEKRGNLPKG
ncbi:hypothetical protein B1742_22865 [Enterobacter kobei]|nr:hypothetical protein B1742_22865 [Enterobacter kobei]